MGEKTTVVKKFKDRVGLVGTSCRAHEKGSTDPCVYFIYQSKGKMIC